MFSIKSAVLTALQTNTALSTLNGFYFFHPAEFTNLPVLSYFELDNTGNLYADNQEIGSEFVYQIDLWHTASTTSYALAVDEAMTNINFSRIASNDLFEADTKIYRKSMRYRLDYSDPNF